MNSTGPVLRGDLCFWGGIERFLDDLTGVGPNLRRDLTGVDKDLTGFGLQFGRSPPGSLHGAGILGERHGLWLHWKMGFEDPDDVLKRSFFLARLRRGEESRER